MVAINWDSTGTRHYETGLDRVVLYTYGNPGVPWFGFRSIEESPNGGDPLPYYIDGVKYLNISSVEEYESRISAIQAPEEFGPCDGTEYLANGLYVTQQARRPFSMSYRSMIGSDTQEVGYAYKIHIVYNVTTSPPERTYASLQSEPTMEIRNWNLTSKPIPFPGLKPISHLIVDSRQADKNYLATLESYLYGSKSRDPMLLNPGQILAILSGEEVDF